MKTASALAKYLHIISSLGSLFVSSSKQLQPYGMDTQDSHRLWNPYKTLDLYSLLDAHPSGCNFSCVGVTLKNARCRWPIPYAMQREACRKLDSIAVETPSSQAVSETISELAHLLLCTQRHQRMSEQRDAKIWDWSAKIEDVAVEIERKGEMTSEILQSSADPSAYQGAQYQLEIDSQILSTSTPSQAVNLDDNLESIQNHQSAVVPKLQYDLNTEDELQKTRRQLDEMKTQVSELETALEEAKAQTPMHSTVGSNPKAQPQGADNITATCDVSN